MVAAGAPNFLAGPRASVSCEATVHGLHAEQEIPVGEREQQRGAIVLLPLRKPQPR